MAAGRNQVSWYGDPGLQGMIAAGLVGLIVYLPSLGGGFVNWDDEDYVRDNLYLRAINGRFVEWAFTEFHAANWYPLTWLSHALDVAAWGLDPLGHHLANVILHAANCALVTALVGAWLARARPAPDSASGNAWGAAAAGIAFALHPIHVEAVAWVSQRKELLCAFFYLAGLLAYLRPACSRGGRAAACGGALACHALALMAKPMAVSFPLILLLLDIHPLGRWRSARSAALALAAKLPFLVLSAGAAVLALRAQSVGGALADADALPLGHRIYTAALALLAYARDTVWPAWLAPLYPYPGVPEFASPAYLVPVVTVAVALASLLALVRRRADLVVTLTLMMVALLPVLGLVQVGGQARADRYLYLPGVVLFGLFGVGAAWGLVRARRAASVALTLLGVAWAALTLQQQAAWRDGVSLWSHQIALHPGYGPGYTYRAHALAQEGHFAAAERDLDAAQRLPPPSPEPDYYRGELRLRQDRPAEALPLLAAALEQTQWPDARFHADLGRAYGLLGRPDLALVAFDHALSIEATPLRRALRACALGQLARTDEALAEFRLLSADLPALPAALDALGRSLSAGRIEGLCEARYRAEPL